MNTMIEGGRDKKQTARLQKAQGIAMKESASEVALKTDYYGKVRELAHRLGLTQPMQVSSDGSCILLHSYGKTCSRCRTVWLQVCMGQ